MHIILTTLDGAIYPVEVSGDLEVINLKALCEQETNIPAQQMSLTHEGKLLSDENRSLESYSIKDNDILMVQRVNQMSNMPLIPNIDFSAIAVPPTSGRPSSSRASNNNNNLNASIAQMRQLFMSNPAKFEMIRQRFPEFADAMQRNDMVKMGQCMSQLSAGLGGAGEEPTGMGFSNELDLEAQKRIAENIRLQNIQQNMEFALEHMPEAFGNVVMLYIDCQVNGHHVKAFVDSGAQMTIMSAACAERCGIMRLVDTRWAGIAKGVGTQKIVGRVHLAQIKIENKFLTTSFSILEEQAMDMLLGLDMLKRHQCVIDLERNVLIFRSTNIETRFLAESELPLAARPQYVDESLQEMSDSKLTPETTNQSGASSSKSSATASAGTSSSNYSDNLIGNLTKLGFSRADVIDALNANNGDESKAKVALLDKLAKSIQFPSMKK